MAANKSKKSRRQSICVSQKVRALFRKSNSGHTAKAKKKKQRGNRVSADAPGLSDELLGLMSHNASAPTKPPYRRQQHNSSKPPSGRIGLPDY